MPRRFDQVWEQFGDGLRPVGHTLAAITWIPRCRGFIAPDDVDRVFAPLGFVRTDLSTAASLVYKHSENLKPWNEIHVPIYDQPSRVSARLCREAHDRWFEQMDRDDFNQFLG